MRYRPATSLSAILEQHAISRRAYNALVYRGVPRRAMTATSTTADITCQNCSTTLNL